MLVRTAGLPSARLDTLAASWKTLETALEVGRRDRFLAQEALLRVLDELLIELKGLPERTLVYQFRQRVYDAKKLPARNKTAQLDPVLNMPLAPVLQAALLRAQAAEEQFKAAQDRFDRAYRQALALGYRSLQDIAGEEQFQRALLFASHSLLGRLAAFRNKPAGLMVKKDRQTAFSILQYATRMAFKTSPLSRFTTVSMLRLSPDDEPPVLDKLALPKSVVTPNVAFLEALYHVLLREQAFYRTLTMRLNPCIVGRQTERYQWLYFHGAEEGFQEADPSPLLDFVVELFLGNDRQMPFDMALQALAGAVEAPEALLTAHLLEWVDLGLLEWNLPERGLSPNWSGNLYRFLGFLPATPVIVATAGLLHWLQTAARSLPYQPIEQAALIQQEAWKRLNDYFSAARVDMPPIPPEQLFYEDVEQAVELPGPALAAIINLTGQLAQCWAMLPAKPIPPVAIDLFSEVSAASGDRQSIDFLTFSRYFLSRYHAASLRRLVGRQRPSHPARIGALLQVYTEGGEYFAVVNAMFAGGGKLFARWMHLFSEGVQDALRQWVSANSTDQTVTAAFPWQGWINANLQPRLMRDALLAPGGRATAAPGGADILLGNVELVLVQDALELYDRNTGSRLLLVDLGLEAPETRLPVQDLLWHLGVPAVSIEALLAAKPLEPHPDGALRFRPRQTWDHLVLARAAWFVDETAWRLLPLQKTFDPEAFAQLRSVLQAWGVPRHFFARMPGEKPQYFDQDSPLLMDLFQRMLVRRNGMLILTEMLPLPGQSVQGERVTEFAVEFSL